MIITCAMVMFPSMRIVIEWLCQGDHTCHPRVKEPALPRTPDIESLWLAMGTCLVACFQLSIFLLLGLAWQVQIGATLVSLARSPFLPEHLNKRQAQKSLLQVALEILQHLLCATQTNCIASCWISSDARNPSERASFFLRPL